MSKSFQVPPVSAERGQAATPWTFALVAQP
jgi:hypothetical protein